MFGRLFIGVVMFFDKDAVNTRRSRCFVTGALTSNYSNAMQAESVDGCEEVELLLEEGTDIQRERWRVWQCAAGKHRSMPRG